MKTMTPTSSARDITVVFKSAKGSFIATLEMQNVPFPHLENAKMRKTYLEKLRDVQQGYGHYQVDFWVSTAHKERQYKKALSEIYEVKMQAVHFSTLLQTSV
jgi:hypothetical protein